MTDDAGTEDTGDIEDTGDTNNPDDAIDPEVTSRLAILAGRPWLSQHPWRERTVNAGRLTALVILVTITVWLASTAGAGLIRSPETSPETPSRQPAPQVPALAPAVPASPPDEASALAGVIEQAERVLYDPAAMPAQIEKAAWAQQLAYRTLVEQPDLQQSVLPLLGAQARASADHAVRAGTALQSVVTAQQELPAWRIVQPAPADELLASYREAEATLGVPWEYLAAIHLVETRMGRIRGSSPSGAQGPMQFLPATWQRYGRGDINDNHDSILAAARLLRENGAPANMARALYRYNPSRQYVQAITAYAEHMAADERAFLGFYHWQVLYKHVDGTVLLPVGYPSVRPQPVSDPRRISS